MWIIFIVIVLIFTVVALGKALGQSEAKRAEQHDEVREELYALRSSEARRSQDTMNKIRDDIARKANPNHGKADWS